MRVFLLLVLAIFAAQAQDAVTVLERREVPVAHHVPSANHELRLTLALLDGSGWTLEAIFAAVQESTRILGHCGVAMENAELVRISAPERFRDFHSATSRELARALPLAKPTIYFVSGTRQNPAFDAEAIGRANSRSRPELGDTVWITRIARDLGIVLAHELAHVLMDNGEHSEEPGNLMRDETASQNTQLSKMQCARLRESGVANGLLRQR